MHVQIESPFDLDTYIMTYVVHAGLGSPHVVIDSVLDYDPKSGRTTTRPVDHVATLIEAQGLRIGWLLKTHMHTDHLSATSYLRRRFGGRTVIGERIRVMQGAFKSIFDLERVFLLDGLQLGHPFAPNEMFRIDNLEAKALTVLGYIPADMAHQMGDTVFVGGTLPMSNVGTIRCNFPGGSADTLYQSICRLLDLPPDTRLHTYHGYPPGGYEAMCHTMVVEQCRANIHARGGMIEVEFMQMRTRRNATLDMPTLMLPATQASTRVNMLSPVELNSIQCLKIPLNALQQLRKRAVRHARQSVLDG